MSIYYATSFHVLHSATVRIEVGYRPIFVNDACFKLQYNFKQYKACAESFHLQQEY